MKDPQVACRQDHSRNGQGHRRNSIQKSFSPDPSTDQKEGDNRSEDHIDESCKKTVEKRIFYEMGRSEKDLYIVAHRVCLWKDGEAPDLREGKDEDAQMGEEADAQYEKRENQNKGQFPTADLL